MADKGINPNLGEATNLFLASLPPEEKAPSQQEVSKFARWFRKERHLSELTPAEVESYAEQLSLSDTDYQKKLELIRAFLAYAKKKGWSKTNLATNLKSKKTKMKSSRGPQQDAPETISLTRQGYEELKKELESLKQESQRLTAEIHRAAADKDFRENVPFHSAREKKGHVEGRIMELEETLKAGVIIDENQKNVGLKVIFGDNVVLCEKGSDAELCYTLVSSKEVDVAHGKISNASPIGMAILGREQGEMVEIVAPVGRLYYLIKRIER
jgi:transcription elongation factor GreA